MPVRIPGGPIFYFYCGLKRSWVIDCHGCGVLLHVLPIDSLGVLKTILQCGKGFDTGPPQVAAGSLSFCGFSPFLVGFLGLPAGFSTRPYFLKGMRPISSEN